MKNVRRSRQLFSGWSYLLAFISKERSRVFSNSSILQSCVHNKSRPFKSTMVITPQTESDVGFRSIGKHTSKRRRRYSRCYLLQWTILSLYRLSLHNSLVLLGDFSREFQKSLIPSCTRLRRIRLPSSSVQLQQYLLSGSSPPKSSCFTRGIPHSRQ